MWLSGTKGGIRCDIIRLGRFEVAKVKINIDPVDKILLKRNLNKNGKAQRHFSSEVRRMADPYVPMRSSVLKNTARVETNRIIYTQPYAKRQYYENKGFGDEGVSKGGRRGKQWIQRMWADRGKDVVKSVAEYVGGKSK